MSGFELLGYLLLAAGFALAAVEMLLPGFGAPGISSIICFALAVGLVSDSLEAALTLVIVILVVLAGLLTVCLVFIRKNRNSPLVLQKQLRPEDGKIGNEDMVYLVGKTGTAVSDLRPSGTAEFEGVEFDVRAEGHFIEKGSDIRITGISGSTLCVKALRKESR